MLGRKSVLFIISDIFGNLITMISFYFVAHRMGPEPLGIINTITSFFSIFIFIANLGISSAYLQMVPAKRFPIAQQNGALILLKLILSFIHILFCYFIAIITGSINEFPLLIFVIISITVFLGNIQIMFDFSFAAKGETAKQKFPILLSNIVRAFGRIISAFIYPTTSSLAVSDLFGLISGMILSIKFFLKNKISLPTKEIIKEYFKFGFPLVFTRISNKMIENLDKIILKLLTNFINVGIYTGGYIVLRPISFAASAMYLILTPTLTKKTAKGDLKSLNLTAIKAEKFLLMITIPFLSFLAWGMYPLSTIFFGKDFHGVENVIIFLGLGLSFRLVSIPYTNQIFAAGKTKLLFLISLFILFVNTTLDFIFIPDKLFNINTFGFGPLGASLATCIAYFFGSIVYRIITYKLTKSRSDFKNIKHILSAPIIIISSLILKENLQFLGKYLNIILSFFYSIIFYLIINLYILKTITYGDLKYFWSAINPRKLKIYIKNELSNDKK